MDQDEPVTLARNRQDGRSVFSLVKEDRRLISCLQLDVGGAWRALCCGWLTLLTAAAAAVHEGLTQILKQNQMFLLFNVKSEVTERC